MPVLLQINATANWGSTGRIVEATGLAAKSHGWDSYVAYGRYSCPSSLGLIKVGGFLNPYLHYLESRLFDREGLGSACATRDLVDVMKRLDPDVVHLHNIHDHWLNYNILFDYLNQSDIKVVWTFHDCWAFTGHCFHFEMAGCDKWKYQCGECPLSRTYPKSMRDNSRENYLLKKRLFTSCRDLTVAACSKWMADYVKDSFFSDRQVHVIHNGIDIDVFRPLEVTSDGRFRILAVSNVWNREKGLYDIYKLRQMLPDDFVITVVGLAKEQLRQIPDGIAGMGRTAGVDELVRLYNEADVLVNASYADTFPTVNLEALSCGTPVVTYDTGGSPEAVDEDTGIVVPRGDVQSLAAALMHLRQHPLSPSACRIRAVENFDKNVCFNKYLELYD